jgi:DnaJ family protein C protein 9
MLFCSGSQLTRPGSEEELEDIREAYEATKGSFPGILSRIPHSTADDEKRFVVAIEAEITAGNLKRTKSWTTTSTDAAAAKKRKRAADKESKAAEEAAKELGVWDEFYGSGKKGRRANDGEKENKKKAKGKAKDDGEDGLAALILRRQKDRAGAGAAALDAIAEKYANLDKKKRKGKAAPEEPHPAELDDDAFAAFQAKLFQDQGDKADKASDKKKRRTKV